MVIQYDGNVGIGTTSPGGLLHLSTVALATPPTGRGRIIIQDQPDNIDSAGGIEFHTHPNGNGWKIVTLSDSTEQLRFLSRVSSVSWTERFSIQKSGNVGIGTTGPGKLLELSGAVPEVSLKDTGAGTTQMTIGAGNLFGTAAGNVRTVTGQPLIFATANAENMRITTSGNVGIGTTSPAQVLDVNGRIRMATWTADGDTAAYQDTATNSIALLTSDRRLKKNITPFTGSLDIIKQFNTYKYNDLDEKEGSKLKLGLLAQEVLPLFPELTYSFTKEDSPETYYGVHYDKLPVLLLDAIKELDAMVRGGGVVSDKPVKRGAAEGGASPTLTNTGSAEVVGTQALSISSSSSAPATPPKGQAVIYMKPDGNLYFKNDKGKEMSLGGGGGWGSVENGIFYLGGAVGIGLEERFSGLTVRAAADKAIQGTTAANKTTQIEGSGTHFLSELGIGDRISLSSSPSTYAAVTAIDSDTSLSVDTALGEGYATGKTINKKSSLFRLEDASRTTQFLVNDAGNVGIGTPSPSAKLQIEGSSARVSSGGNYVDIGSAATEISGSGPYKFRTKDNDLSIYSFKNLALGSNNKENILYLNTKGMVGVGTNNPEAVLQVEGQQGPVALQVNSNETRARNTVFLINSDVGGDNKGIFRVLADGSTFADGPYAGSGADYAEWFEKEGELNPKDVVGLNVHTGKVRRYQAGDPLIGVISVNPVVIGNRLQGTSDEEMKRDFALVSLVGQVDIDPAQMREKEHEILSTDGFFIGYRLANGRVYMASPLSSWKIAKAILELADTIEAQKKEIEQLKGLLGSQKTQY